jgi:hypothetical protein
MLARSTKYGKCQSNAIQQRRPIMTTPVEKSTLFFNNCGSAICGRNLSGDLGDPNTPQPQPQARLGKLMSYEKIVKLACKPKNAPPKAKVRAAEKRRACIDIPLIPVPRSNHRGNVSGGWRSFGRLQSNCSSVERAKRRGMSLRHPVF